MLESLPCLSHLSFTQDRTHRRCRIGCFGMLLLIFVPYVCYGLYKLTFDPISGKFRNVELEIEPWLESETLLAPNPLCIAEMNKEMEVVAKYHNIPNGNFKA